MDEGELTGFVTKASRPAQVPVAGYDLTFSPVKSVSALWALAPAEVAMQVEAAHQDAVRATLAMLEQEVAFTRVGKGGIRQVPVTGLVGDDDPNEATTVVGLTCFAIALLLLAVAAWKAFVGTTEKAVQEYRNSR